MVSPAPLTQTYTCMLMRTHMHTCMHAYGDMVQWMWLQIANLLVVYTEANGGRWMSPKEAIFPDAAGRSQERLAALLTMLGCPVCTSMPVRVAESCLKYTPGTQKLTPARARSQLKWSDQHAALNMLNSPTERMEVHPYFLVCGLNPMELCSSVVADVTALVPLRSQGLTNAAGSYFDCDHSKTDHAESQSLNQFHFQPRRLCVSPGLIDCVNKLLPTFQVCSYWY